MKLMVEILFLVRHLSRQTLGQRTRALAVRASRAAALVTIATRSYNLKPSPLIPLRSSPV
jgi:hypothetical protein